MLSLSDISIFLLPLKNNFNNISISLVLLVYASIVDFLPINITDYHYAFI